MHQLSRSSGTVRIAASAVPTPGCVTLHYDHVHRCYSNTSDHRGGAVRWAAEAEAGASLVYHRGYLAFDRLTLAKAAARAALDRLADRAHDLAAHGTIG